MGIYTIPGSVKIRFDINDFPELNDRIFRILWISISIGHLRDQYFDGYISKAVKRIKTENPRHFKDFFKIIGSTDLYKFGKSHLGRRKENRSSLWCSFEVTPTSKRWWRQVWNLIKYNGDIKLVHET